MDAAEWPLACWLDLDCGGVVVVRGRLVVVIDMRRETSCVACDGPGRCWLAKAFGEGRIASLRDLSWLGVDASGTDDRTRDPRRGLGGSVCWWGGQDSKTIGYQGQLLTSSSSNFVS